MNVPYETIKSAKEIIKEDRNDKLFCSLAEWHTNKGLLPSDEHDLTFWSWVEVRLDYMAGEIGMDRKPTDIKAEELVEALRVNSMGVRLARECKSAALKDGFQSDICCYVEEGMVYASVYIGGKSKEEDGKRAKEIAEKFFEKGYATEVWHDDEDETDVTMNAWISFPIYMKGGLS